MKRKELRDMTYDEIRETKEYKERYNEINNKNLHFDYFKVKIVTLDGMYYTVMEWSKDEIVLLWMYMEGLKEETDSPVSLDDVMDEMKKRGCSYIMGYPDICDAGNVSEGLLYLAKENKIINKNQIKETVYQMI